MANTSATYDEVKAFLDRMRTCLTLLGGHVVYDTRGKNEQFMVDMEWDGRNQMSRPGLNQCGNLGNGLKVTCVTLKCS